jgi:DNA-binding transcriptional regulator of glucitol operon
LDALELFISAKKGFVVIAWLGLAWLGWQKYSEYGSALAVGSRAF